MTEDELYTLKSYFSKLRESQMQYLYVDSLAYFTKDTTQTEILERQ